MLTKLKINNYALIDSLEISFNNGMTSITGETGAGKSIILGGLSMVLGSRVDNSKIINKFSPIVDNIIETQSMQEAVKISEKIAEKKEFVLLSPACASYDLFKNYIDRGNQFKEAVRNLWQEVKI